MRKVRIKSWADMEKEFGLTKFGDIDMMFRWTIKMEQIIPEDRIISLTHNDAWLDNDYSFIISEDMIAEYILEDLEIPENSSENTLPEIVQLSQPEKSDSEIQDEINKEFLNSIGHRTGHIHYIKWNITDNLSIRYFYNFADRPEYNMKFTLKNHKERTLVEIDENTAKEMIMQVCRKEPYQEIIGYQQKGKGKGYKKIIMQNDQISEISESLNDKLVK